MTDRQAKRLTMKQPTFLTARILESSMVKSMAHSGYRLIGYMQQMDGWYRLRFEGHNGGEEMLGVIPPPA